MRSTADVVTLILLPIIIASLIAVMEMYPTEYNTMGCPTGYDLRTGVRRDGRFECWPHPVGDPEWDGTWRRSPDRSTQSDAIVRNRIICTGGAHPIVIDYKTVGCQR